jgi:integrase
MPDMASVASVSKLKNRARKPWRARYRDPQGRERTQHFARKVDAERFLEQVRSDIITGRYVDPTLASRPFGDYAREWAARQMHRESTSDQLHSHLERHVLPYLGDRPIGALRRSELQSWIKGRSEELAPATVKVIAAWVGSILRAAVDDGLIVASPFRGVALPKRERRGVVPLATEQVLGLIAGVPERYRALIATAAGTGLRQGELFGLTADAIDWLGRRLRVEQQLVTLVGQAPKLGPPKTPASYRTVPLPDVVLEALAEHVRGFPPGEFGLIFTDEKGRPLRRSNFSLVWTPAARSCGIPSGTGVHALRHYYASVLIAGGESVKVVQARLGHATAAETLDTYSHLWPDSEDHTRAVVDAAFRRPATPDVVSRPADQ